jgi:hypothetical protein
MTRYVIDAPTLLHVVDEQLTVDSDHQLVAPSSIRSQALQLLWNDVRRGPAPSKAPVRCMKP